MTSFPMQPIATIYTDLPAKFGIPRQSGLVPELRGEIVFSPEYRQPEAVRGLEEFSHIWLIWLFSESAGAEWAATVRPPRLGGNERVGVFASRSPYRPNPVGLSCVRLDRVEQDSARGPVLHVSGIDLMHGTPILDIKPYIPYADSQPDATGGFTDRVPHVALNVSIPIDLLERIPAEKHAALHALLAQDVRPSYQADPEREYGLYFAGHNVRFRVRGTNLTVFEVTEIT